LNEAELRLQPVLDAESKLTIDSCSASLDTACFLMHTRNAKFIIANKRALMVMKLVVRGCGSTVVGGHVKIMSVQAPHEILWCAQGAHVFLALVSCVVTFSEATAEVAEVVFWMSMHHMLSTISGESRAKVTFGETMCLQVTSQCIHDVALKARVLQSLPALR
jgi:hypothetical protein